MRIARVRVRNFRCFAGTSEKWGLDWLPNRDLNLLIGSNGCGKTSLVDAIDLVLSWEGRANRGLVTEYDFPWCDTTKTIKIEVTLTDIGPAIGEFPDAIQFVDNRNYEPIDETDQPPLDGRHERAVIIRFEAKRDDEDGEIHERWLFPKFRATEYEDERELSRKQHQAIAYFRIRPLVSGGSFTLGEYSALGRHLRKLNYALGRLPDKLKPTQKLPECKLQDLQCEQCAEESCKNKVQDVDGEKKPQTLGKMLADIALRTRTLLGDAAWVGMGSCLGPRYGGLRASLAAITLGVRPLEAQGDEFIPFDRLSAGERYAMSFSLATQQLPGSSAPIIVMEEPETALYPSAIGKVMAQMHGANSPQVIVTSHAESVVRRFAIEHIFRVDSRRSIKRADAIAGSPSTLRELERLIMPGRTSALFADKVLVVEGGGDAFTLGALDRLAGMGQKSLAAAGWMVFNANRADNVPETVEAMKGLGIKVAALLDADEKGRENAEKTKDKCPVFTYQRHTADDMTLELALLYGLDAKAQKQAVDAFQKYPDCSGCPQKIDVRNCIGKNGCHLPTSTAKEALKAELRDSCLERYTETDTFPRAFADLIEKLDGTPTGEIIELSVGG